MIFHLTKHERILLEKYGGLAMCKASPCLSVGTQTGLMGLSRSGQHHFQSAALTLDVLVYKNMMINLFLTFHFPTGPNQLHKHCNIANINIHLRIPKTL